ncbi:MAG: hypothetical protein KAT83_00135 [Candidatus Aenigmarchaeota archaeon]|nr:hypothetical protein [Candidatus Aenigmarchaeota archaeon]
MNPFMKGSLFLLLLVALGLIVSPQINADTDEDTFNVTVNISAVAQIIVIPTSLSWAQLSPGSNGAVQNVSLKNIGSLNLSTIYASANTITLESANPLGSGEAPKYAAPGLMMVQNATSGSSYYHLGRLEWNLSAALAGEVFPALEPTWSHGWYRNSSGNEYLWLLMNGTDGTCNTSTGNPIFRIKTAPENDTSMKRDLTTEVTTGDVCGGSYTAPSSSESWGVFSCSGATNPLNGHFVAVYYDCTKIYIYNYDKSSTFPTVNAVPYFWSSTIYPGDETYMNLIAAVPLGIPAGDTQEGTITITAST